MNNNLIILNEQEILGKHFRVFGTPEEPLFLAKDVSEWIEHTDLSRMVDLVDEDEKLKRTMYVSGQNREVWLLTENGLYEVLMQSRKPLAKQFKKQVKVILKSIRKHGMYAKDELLDNPDLLEEVVHKLKEEKHKRIQAEKQLEEQKPKVDLYDEVMNTDGLLNFIQVADSFGQCGRNTLMSKLRDSDILMSGEHTKNIPYSQYAKYFSVVVRPRKTKEGLKDIATTLCKPSALKLIKRVLDKEKDLQLKQAN